MGAPLDLIGQRFGRLIVIERIGADAKRYVQWKCRCDCGKIVSVSTRDLRSRFVVSCGCNRIEKSKANLASIPTAAKLGQKDGTNLSRIRSSRPQKNTTSGVRGVSRLPNGAYRAYVYYRHKRYEAGIYHDLNEAKQAVEELRVKILSDIHQNTMKSN